MNTNIVSVKYEDSYIPRSFSGKSYSYYTDKDLKVGDLVEAPTKYGNNIAIVTEINILEEKIQQIKPYMKTISRRINKERYIKFAEILEEIA